MVARPDLAWVDHLPPAVKQALLAEVVAELNGNKLADYRPYRKQVEFHNAGADEGIRERLLMAGNQLGKTVAGSFEASMHLTGRYPDWWDGVGFAKETAAWAASLTSQSTRDTVQRLLLGKPGEWGTGAIPRDSIVEVKRASHGVSDAVESIVVRHGGGGDVQAGRSRLTIKTYDQGRERWQGETLNFVWFDEEPPLDIYIEGLTRTNATQGIAWLTFTPLLGMSDVVRRFLIDKVPGTHVTTMTIEDADHYTPEQRKAIIASYPPHEREARAKGIPTLGSGRIFPVPEEVIRVNAFPIPAHWPRICGLDFGWDHPTGAAWLAWDRDTDTVYVYDCYRVKEQTPVVHAATIKGRGTWIPVAWPHDGLQHDKGSGEALADQYRKLGVKMLPQKATNPAAKGEAEGTGGNGVEAALMDMLDRMQTGRFKVFAHLNDWWEEFRLYHREDGKIVKIGDDIMSATRYGSMMLRHAKVQPERGNSARVPAYTQNIPSAGMLG